MWFDGIPVLFLPGNSGSHMQARSLASVALRMAIAKNYEYHFDYYTISFNEELSGLYGGVLDHQTKFAAACISKILNLYKSNKYTKSIPSSVILIGHSMGGLIAKRLMAYPSTLNTTSVTITLAAPLQAPVVNTDITMNDFYTIMDFEWDMYINKNDKIKSKKMLVSFGNGPRDVLMPSGLTSSNDSDISALTTALPGVWVSPDHVSIVWCKQLVLSITRFLFASVDLVTDQISERKEIWMSKATHFFQANRSIYLDRNIRRHSLMMQADAFWYEDSRRIYQISRPEINRMTYLMVRLVTFPQNRFVAIEAVNVIDKDWIFGCNAMYTYGTYRYCKNATSLSELSRWTGAAINFGKRKLATINLHTLKDIYPDWTHVVVRVSPTRKPITLNVDINDHASRIVTVDLPSDIVFGRTIIKAETEPESLYYELILPGFDKIHQAYLLYVEPTANCKADQYHVSAELHVPWARNHEYSHYYTHLKHSPMKLRLFASNPNITSAGETSQHPKVTLLLDPQCTFTISIEQSWYQRLAQLSRNYTIVLVPYIVAILLLAVRSNILNLKNNGNCVHLHAALMSEGVKPYYALVFARVCTMVSILEKLRVELFYTFTVVLPVYMTALGIFNILAAVVLAIIVFSSQLAHRLLFRIIWRGGPTIVENVASGLQKMPLVVSAALVCAVPLSCGAASLAAGAAFYAFVLSKMYEEYLEDYVYILMAKIASRICRLFNSKKKADSTKNSHHGVVMKAITNSNENNDDKENENNTENKDELQTNNSNPKTDIKGVTSNEMKESTTVISKESENNVVALVKSNVDTESSREKQCNDKPGRKMSHVNNIDSDLTSLHFHVLMFFLWASVTMVNVPVLLTWARNFKYTVILKPDTSYAPGLIMSVCSIWIWQMDGPRKYLKHYEQVASLLFIMSVLILALGPMSLMIVNYGVTFSFALITIQQLYDEEITDFLTTDLSVDSNDDNEQIPKENNASEDTDNINNGSETEKPESSNDCDVCNESRIYNVFKNIKEKLNLSEDT
ncbi:hypothetical protein ACJJTC_013420 [Scirpophaga incertulas]